MTAAPLITLHVSLYETSRQLCGLKVGDGWDYSGFFSEAIYKSLSSSIQCPISAPSLPGFPLWSLAPLSSVFFPINGLYLKSLQTAALRTRLKVGDAVVVANWHYHMPNLIYSFIYFLHYYDMKASA